MNDAAAFSSVAAASVMVFLLFVMYKLLARHVNDVFGLFIITFGLFYGFRAVLIAVGLDTPNPDYLFAGTDVNALTVKSISFLVLFLISFSAGALVTGSRPARSSGVLFIGHEISTRRMVTVTLALTLVTAVISTVLMSTYGGFGELMTAAKVDKALAGSYYLKTPMFLGALIATATVLDIRRKRDYRWAMLVVILACAAFNSVMVFAWGQRSAVAIVVAMALLGSVRPGGEGGSSTHALQTVGRMLLAAIMIVSVAAGLRIARDNLTNGSVQDAYADGNVFRQASLGVNATFFDASMLAYRDWPNQHPLRGGEDFLNGALGSLPRAVWADKPDPMAGSWFRKVYEPEVVNGWPTGAPTIWYINFGLVGIVLGGLVSGMVLGWLAARRRAGPATGINVALTFVICVFVLQLGLSSDTPARAVTWLLPLSIVLVWLRLPDQRAGRSNPPVRLGRGAQPVAMTDRV